MTLPLSLVSAYTKTADQRAADSGDLTDFHPFHPWHGELVVSLQEGLPYRALEAVKRRLRLSNSELAQATGYAIPTGL